MVQLDISFIERKFVYISVGRILFKNKFSGVIPREIGSLSMLELLDLRDNNLSGEIPMELGNMMSLKHLYVLCNVLPLYHPLL